MDLLIGGQTTASAKFAVLNMTGSGTPTASISAGTGITGGAFLTAAGNLATTNKQSLTLGGSTTGDISFKPANIQSLFLSSITGRVGLGTQVNPKGLLDISGDAGNNATLIVNNTGATTSDLITASTSGTTRFTVDNTGNIQFTGGHATALSKLASSATSNQTYTLPATGGIFCLDTNNCASSQLWTTSLGALYPGNSTMDLLIGGTTTSSANLRVTGNSAFQGTTSAASIAAKTSFAGFVIDNTGVGDIFTASKSGATKFTILNNGNIQFAPGQSALSTLTKLGTTAQTFSFPDATGTICLQNTSCGFSLGTNFWTETSNPGGALTTINSTMDLLIGGQTTASAKFAVLNISPNLPARSNSNSFYLCRNRNNRRSIPYCSR